jgi:ACS family D-galactonate transporter-like MFS transporter
LEGNARLPLRSVVSMCTGRASWAMIFFGLLTWGPTYLAQSRGLDLKGIGASTFFIFFSAALGSLCGGFLCDALVTRGAARGRVVKGMVLVSGLVTLCALLGLSHIADAKQAVAALCVAAFFLMWGSLYWSLPSLLVPAHRVGFVGGLMNCAGSCGGILIPIVTGLLLQATGSFDAVINFFSASALVYVMATLFIELRHTR